MAKKKPPGKPSGHADARIEKCRHCGEQIAYRRDTDEPRYFNEVAPRHCCPGRDQEDRERQQQRRREAEIDALVQPIIAARLGAFLPMATAAVQMEPSVVYRDEVAPTADEEERRNRKAERLNRQMLIRQLLHRPLARIVELVPTVTRKELTDYIDTCFPAPSPSRPSAPLDPALVQRAHGEIVAAYPDLKCREACQELATRLGVSRRKIESLRRPRKK